MIFISKLFSEELINAFGWTILHSLWQGAAIALGFALILFFMKKCSSRTRYYVGIMALLLVLSVSMVTFVHVYQSQIPAGGQEPGNMVMKTSTATLIGEPPAPLEGNKDARGFLSKVIPFFQSYFNQHLPLVVSIWFMGILFMLLRLIGGVLYNQRVRVHQTKRVPVSWQKKLDNLCSQTEIKRKVSFLESALAKVPLTIGHFKPVILFPIGMITGLPKDQIEALLAHELAHIARNDYLINVFQNMVDIAFFFHPGVQWISSQIRSERENCCDDVAVSISGDSINFVKALANVPVFGVRNTEPALAATGHSYKLLGRIKRLLAPPKSGSTFGEGFAVALILGVCFFTVFLSASSAGFWNSGGSGSGVYDHTSEQGQQDVPGDLKSKGFEVEKKEEKQKVAQKNKKIKKLDYRDFSLKEKGKVELKGKIKAKKDSSIKNWIVELKENKVVWSYKNIEEKIKKGKYSFVSNVYLKKGNYRWYFPKGLESELKIRYGVDPSEELSAVEEATIERGQKQREQELEQIEEELERDREAVEREEDEKLSSLREILEKREKELRGVREDRLEKIEKKLIALEKAERENGEKRIDLLEKELKILEEKKLSKAEKELFKVKEKELNIVRRNLGDLEKDLVRKHRELERVKEIELKKLKKEFKKQESLSKHRNKKELKKALKEFEKREKELRKVREVELIRIKEDLIQRKDEFKEQEKELKKHEKVIQTLKNELKKDKLIDDIENFQFKMTQKELIINGKKQSKKWHKKYLELYEKERGKKLKNSWTVLLGDNKI
jgi:bla regulator protein BlaR1